MSAIDTMGFPETSEIMREQWKEIGIDMALQIIDIGVLVDQVLTRRDFDITVLGGLQGPYPSEWVEFVGTTNGIPNFRNCMNYTNPEIERLFDEYCETTDKEERKRIFFEIQEIVAEDLPRYNYGEYSGIIPKRSNLKGVWFEHQNESRSYDLSKIYKEEWAELITMDELVKRVDKLNDNLTMTTIASVGLGIVAIVLSIVAIRYARKSK